MAGFTSKDRQRIIDGYLQQSGRNAFVPGQFVDWLENEPEHEAYDWFFAKDDAAAAREYRIGLARRMASGLRITVSDSESHQKSRAIKIASVTETITPTSRGRQFPAYISPVGSRSSGGGYERVLPGDPASMAELRRQGATALLSWLARYRGAMEDGDIDLTAVDDLAEQISADAEKNQIGGAA